MRDAVIVDAVRTPVGKRNGALSVIHPADLSAITLSAIVARTGIDPEVVDDVVWEKPTIRRADYCTFDVIAVRQNGSGGRLIASILGRR